VPYVFDSREAIKTSGVGFANYFRRQHGKSSRVKSTHVAICNPFLSICNGFQLDVAKIQKISQLEFGKFQAKYNSR
jgi:hypothetical protein